MAEVETRWSDWTKRIVIIGMALLGIGLVYISRPVLHVLVFAAIIAFLLVPVVNFLHRRWHLPRWFSIFLAYLLLLLGMLLIPLLVVPAVINAVNSIHIDFVGVGRRIVETLREHISEYRFVTILGFTLDLSGIVDPIEQGLEGVLPQSALPSIEDLIGTVPGLIKTATGVAYSVAEALSTGLLFVFLTLIYSFYLVLDSPKMGKALRVIVPPAYRREYRLLATKVHQVWSAYFQGQLLLCTFIGVLTWLGNMIIGMPGAFALGLIAGVLELIPNLGPILALIPALTIALLQGSAHLAVSNFVFALITVGLYVLIQQVENNFLVPRIIGEAVDLPPLVVLVGVVVGVNAAGLTGALLAAPVIGTGRVLLHYVLDKLMDRDPFPEVTEAAKEKQEKSERSAKRDADLP